MVQWGTVESRRIFRFDLFALDTKARELSKGGTRIRLRGQPYLILEALLARPGEVVTRDEIRGKLWPADTFVDFEHGLNTSVKKLRQVLCDSADQPRYIETIPRLGYRFIAPVETAGEPTADAKPEAYEPAISSSEPVPVRARFRRWWIAAAALVAAGAMLALSLAVIPIFVLPRLARSHDWLKAEKTPRQFTSLAVLPLENRSSDPSQEYFADGMTDELITDLAQLGSVRVISRTSVTRYKGSNKTAPQIGRELGADALIEGTVERVGDRVRIRVQLIDAASDRHIWAQSYDRALKNVLLLQTTAARDIVTEMQGQVGELRGGTPMAGARTVVPNAYEAYLKAHYFQNKRTDDTLQKSIEYFQQAIAADPAFAQAYAGLAETYSLLGSSVMPAPVMRAKAKAAASKAVELDPTIAEGHTQLGLVEFYYDWNWPGAQQEFERAIEINPSYANAHRWYSYYLRAMGRFPEALREAQKAKQLDPLSLSISVSVAGRYRDTHRYAQALEENQQTLELDPNFVPAHEALAALYQEQGEFQLALSECNKAFQLSHDNPSSLANLGYAYAISGDRASARKIVNQLINDPHYVAAWDVAVIFAGLNDPDSAFQWLERSYRERESQMPFLLVDHRLARLHSDPRFQSLVRRIGLPLTPVRM